MKFVIKNHLIQEIGQVLRESCCEPKSSVGVFVNLFQAADCQEQRESLQVKQPTVQRVSSFREQNPTSQNK